eukprot:GHRR01027233.1.p1 GENE.GHRR01027233.1~~GHRR01027233.1.p1  ORF type:complete len:133 (+),score=17.29 GHRR01027233.1:389-787(+)
MAQQSLLLEQGAHATLLNKAVSSEALAAPHIAVTDQLYLTGVLTTCATNGNKTTHPHLQGLCDGIIHKPLTLCHFFTRYALPEIIKILQANLLCFGEVRYFGFYISECPHTSMVPPFRCVFSHTPHPEGRHM